MRRGSTLLLDAGVTLPAIGDVFMGGYFAGVIDTTRPGSIAADDAYTTGLRYALVVSDASLQISKSWKDSSTAVFTAARTRWDGLSASAALASDAAIYPAADYCYGLTYPSDAASAWYLPAMDELELLYRNLKAISASNSVGSQSTSGKAFPTSTGGNGQNISSDPTGAGYTSGNPAQTSVAAFQSGGAQALGQTGTTRQFWSSTEFGSNDAWTQYMSNSSTSFNGAQTNNSKTGSCIVRPVRRLLL